MMKKKNNIWMKKMKCFNKVQRKPKAKILKKLIYFKVKNNYFDKY